MAGYLPAYPGCSHRGYQSPSLDWFRGVGGRVWLTGMVSARVDWTGVGGIGGVSRGSLGIAGADREEGLAGAPTPAMSCRRKPEDARSSTTTSLGAVGSVRERMMQTTSAPSSTRRRISSRAATSFSESWAGAAADRGASEAAGRLGASVQLTRSEGGGICRGMAGGSGVAAATAPADFPSSER